jgi:hypothetical protein
MKEFVIEDFVINSDNSIDIEYYFYSELKNINFNKEQIKEVFKGISYEGLHEEFNQDDCIKLLKHHIREYKEKKIKT